MSKIEVPKVKLNNGVYMPALGYGTFRIDPKDTYECVRNALDVGYRMIDTAEYYQNEEAVGKAIKDSGIPRDEIFITSKVWLTNFGEKQTTETIQGILKRLQTDYVDLLLIHQPFNDYYGAYRALESAYRQGKARAIGVSNFYVDRFIDLAFHADIVPQVNQMETHIYNQQKELQKYLNKTGTKLEAWGPFAQAKMGLFEDENLIPIAKKHDKTVAQVALRYLHQRDIIVIPKTTHKERMKENIDIFDFELSSEEMAAISKLDRKETVGKSHRDPERVLSTIDKKLVE